MQLTAGNKNTLLRKGHHVVFSKGPHILTDQRSCLHAYRTNLPCLPDHNHPEHGAGVCQERCKTQQHRNSLQLLLDAPAHITRRLHSPSMQGRPSARAALGAHQQAAPGGLLAGACAATLGLRIAAAHAPVRRQRVHHHAPAQQQVRHRHAKRALPPGSRLALLVTQDSLSHSSQPVSSQPAAVLCCPTSADGACAATRLHCSASGTANPCMPCLQAEKTLP